VTPVDTTKTDISYWLGAFAMAAAMTHRCLENDRPDLALLIVEHMLNRFEASPALDDDLRQELSKHWPLKRQEAIDDDRDVLRPLRELDRG
jgi:hypothetical protein